MFLTFFKNQEILLTAYRPNKGCACQVCCGLLPPGHCALPGAHKKTGREISRPVLSFCYLTGIIRYDVSLKDIPARCSYARQRFSTSA